MGEHKCVVGYCCCGCSLRSGSLAIGITLLILSLLNAIYNIYRAIQFGIATFWITFALNLLIVIVSCILIQGIRTERRGFIMAWVWTMAVLILINIVLAVVMVVTINIPTGVVYLLVLALYIYLVIVVRSYGLTLGSSGGVA